MNLFKKITKDELDVALINSQKLGMQYLELISKLRVEHDNTLKKFSEQFEKMQSEKNNKIKSLETQLSKINSKYV